MTDDIISFFEAQTNCLLTEEGAEKVFDFAKDDNSGEANADRLNLVVDRIRKEYADQSPDHDAAEHVIDADAAEYIIQLITSDRKDEPVSSDMNEKMPLISEERKVAREIGTTLREVSKNVILLDITRIGKESGKYAGTLIRYDSPRNEWRKSTTMPPSLIATTQSMINFHRQRWHLICSIFKRDPNVLWWDQGMSQNTVVQSYGKKQRALHTTELLLGRVSE